MHDIQEKVEECKFYSKQGEFFNWKAESAGKWSVRALCAFRL